MDSKDMQALVGSLLMLGVGMVSLIVAVLMARGNATAWKWFGISVKFHARAGIFATAGGLLNLGHFVVPHAFADEYTTFFLATTALLVVVLIGTALRDHLAR